MKLLNSLLIVSCLSGGLFMASSCNKKKDTIAKIHVKNSQNQLVPDCRVILKGECTPPCTGTVDWYDTTYTNAMGEAIFNFTERYQKGMAGVAILKIEAKKDAETGTGIIKIEEEKINEETVFIHP